jgi:hypothetical protein
MFFTIAALTIGFLFSHPESDFSGLPLNLSGYFG